MASIESKVFVVGVPRSGTTLVQSLLASHPSVYATRETHLMVNVRRPLTPLRTWVLDYVWLSQQRVQGALEYLREQCPDLYRTYEAQRPPFRSLAGAARGLDTLFSETTLAQQKTAWVEKSPEHGGYVAVLEKAIPEAKFVHTIRDPRDNVASLYDAGQRYADRWKNRQSLEQCIDTYRNYLGKSQACLSRDSQRHYFVGYEDLIEQPEAQTEALLDFVELKKVPVDMATLNSGSAALSDHTEGWKKEQGPGIQDTRLVKYNQLFDEAQKRQIEEETADLHQQFVATVRARSSPG